MLDRLDCSPKAMLVSPPNAAIFVHAKLGLPKNTGLLYLLYKRLASQDGNGLAEGVLFIARRSLGLKRRFGLKARVGCDLG